MMLSYRLSLIPGALIALMIIEAAAMVGVALAAGEPALMYEGLERFGLDVLLIVAGVCSSCCSSKPSSIAGLRWCSRPTPKQNEFRRLGSLPTALLLRLRLSLAQKRLFCWRKALS